MIDIYFLSPEAAKYADELRGDKTLLATYELGPYTAYVVETFRGYGHFYVDLDRTGISMSIRDNHNSLLVKLERLLMDKLESNHDTCDLAFHNCGMSFKVHCSPLAKEPLLLLEYQIVSPAFYYSLI